MATLTKEQIEKIVQDLSGHYGRVKLQCDSYTITLQVKLYSVKGMTERYCVFVYVNGAWEYKWSTKETDESRRFGNREKTFTYKTKKEREKKHKSWKAIKRLGIDTEDTSQSGFTYYNPAWFSSRLLIKHILKNNSDVSLIEN